MAPKLTLTNPTNAQIDAAVAEHVAGWRLFGDTGRGYPPSKRNDGRNKRMIPPFSTSAGCVLPLLEKVGMWKAEQFLPFDICRKGQAYRVSVANRHAADFCYADSDSFPLAACIALLRAHGVEVTLNPAPPRPDAGKEKEA